MAIQILSDLHLESPKAYDVFEIVPNAPYLALLGDIGNIVVHQEDCLGFLTRQLQQFRIVFFVPGNHEAYGSDWTATLAVLRAFQDDARKDLTLGEFVLLDREAFRLPSSNVIILGCSLFSHVPPDRCMDVSFGLNDFFQIRDWDVDAHNEAHRRDLAWLNAKVADLEGASEDVRIVIMSHWCPIVNDQASDPRHVGSRISSGFMVDMSGERCFKSDKVKLWAFGHTHYNCDFSVTRGDGAGPLRLLANQRGYYFAQTANFDGGKTVEL
ncbi:hypothetical protein BT67DRAFT_281374 [Trichocladium antarcticum]|uniref:Calcineurin-like phosphoesterase domain-containing protein n=1 Tax=Trichocladium antarcticum TaxID=1450529 RepID=A0AAN6UN47_9PEZI|nr:hypothetical protein BT67DRAFT_281374 [Trichocladium antarcticum]